MKNDPSGFRSLSVTIFFQVIFSWWIGVTVVVIFLTFLGIGVLLKRHQSKRGDAMELVKFIFDKF
mgnify:CR=1 FL=1